MKKIKKTTLTMLLVLTSIFSVSATAACSCEPFWQNFFGIFVGHSIRYSWVSDGVGCCSSEGGYMPGMGLAEEWYWGDYSSPEASFFTYNAYFVSPSVCENACCW